MTGRRGGIGEDGWWIDAFRRSPARLGGAREYKEWQHFLVHARDVHLLVNFSLIDDTWTGGAEVGRVIALARREGWEGDVERIAPEDMDLAAGRIDARFGRHAMRFDGRSYHIEVELARRPLKAHLRFDPTSVPAVAWNQPLAASRSLSWLFVPRLEATGEIELRGERFAFERAPAYHDHNWGHFRWGDDFSWEWGSALSWDPACPWSLVYMRMADRRRTRVICQGLYLWRNESHHRVFRDRQVSVQWQGPWRSGRSLKVPRVMGLLSPGEGGDLPNRIEVRGVSGDDEVTLAFEPADAAEVVMPSEVAPTEIAALHECWGRVRAWGRVGGEEVALDGPGVFEFVRD